MAMNKKKSALKKKPMNMKSCALKTKPENTKRKGGVGRRKIPIEKIQKAERLRSCFSKRYASLFSKARVLQDLRPGARVAVIVQCPNGWDFKASEPDSDINSIIDTYLSEIDEDEIDEFDETHGSSEIVQSSDSDCAGTSAAGSEIEGFSEIHLNPNSPIGGEGFPCELEYDQSFSDLLWMPEKDDILEDLGFGY